MIRVLIFLTLPLTAAGKISYNRDIRPILSENCFFCHGFDKEKREAGLRLDTFQGATSRKSSAIVPGKPEESELIYRIFTDDEDDHMPPLDSAYRLTREQKDALKQWIKEGAEYEEHWAYQKLTRPEVPALAKHPVDAFLKRTWDEQKVRPVKKATPRVLLRRLSYDLRGLPPAPEEVASFEKDPSPEHYKKFVDRWLASLEHAEHQGLLWLDLVRHADSNGMVSDEPIASAPYRKYVIEAFRDNMPFDQFTREQLAGDLLPGRNDRTLTASAYNRIVNTNCEAGVIEKEALYALKGEHVRALGTVWMGTTTGCAECHDHKYDPISAKDYYSLAAFFDDLIEAGVYEPGDRRVPLHYLHEKPADITREHQLAREIDQKREKLYSAAIDKEKFAVWKKKIFADEKAAGADKKPVDWPWLPAKLGAVHILKGDFEQLPQGRKTSGPKDKITRHYAGETLVSKPEGTNNAFFTHVTLDPKNMPEFVGFQIVNGAYRRVGWHQDYHTTYFWGPRDHPLLKESQPWLSSKKIYHMGPLPEAGKKVRLEVPKTKFGKASYVPQVMAWIHAGGTVIWGDSGYVTTAAQAFKNRNAGSAYRYFWELPFNRDDRKDFHSLLMSSLKKSRESRRGIHQKIINTAFRESINPELTQKLTDLYREIYHLRRDALPTLVSKAGTPKKTHVLTRGNFMDESGPQAFPGLPAHFSKSFSGDKRLTRLDLANWIMSKDNPLTARVFVNRLWHQFYGRGISETLEDSGNQGDWPSHVHLLDWLATEFQQSNWNIRHMIQLLTTSEAYQLSSIPTYKLTEMDPSNRLHARQGRHRHSAEEIRDSALHAAGLLKLTKEIPTASFFPYQPDPYWAKSNKVMFGSRYQIWETNLGDDQYQRSLYTFWKRQNIHPAMLALDAPTRQECTARRTITNTPAQALALLNDPQFAEAARVLAERVLTESSGDQRIDKLFQLTLQRPPSPTEKIEIQTLLEQLAEQYKESPEDAAALLKTGQYPTTKLDPIEHAAWTGVSRVTLNLHEFLTRN